MIFNNVYELINSGNKYDIIYTDPPWQQKKGGAKKVRPNSSGGDLPYKTMNMEDIKELHKSVFENVANDNHCVFMWCINKYLVDVQKWMEELGYTLHARIVWNKKTGMCPAYTVRFQTEYLLWFYKKGHIILPRKEAQGKYADYMEEVVKRHSQKPECAYKMLEDMFDGKSKVELFARIDRDGWDSMGDELEQ